MMNPNAWTISGGTQILRLAIVLPGDQFSTVARCAKSCARMMTLSPPNLLVSTSFAKGTTSNSFTNQLLFSVF